MPSTGLRERKKERTRANITRVALELFVRDGFAATTVSAIADAADVAPRTVSTYFPSKDGIVFCAYRPGIERLRNRLAARQPGETVLDAVRQWIRDQEDEPIDWTSPMVVRAEDVADVDFARLRAAAIERDPELWALQRRVMREVETLIADAAAEDLGPGLPARVLGATTVAALLELNAYAAQGDRGTVDALDDVLEFLRAGVAGAGK